MLIVTGVERYWKLSPHLSCTVIKIWYLKDSGVTWRHRSRDRSTCGGRLPMGGPLWQRVYLAPL